MLNGLFENTSHLPNEVLKNLDTIQNNQTNLQNVGQQYLTTNSTYNDQEEWNLLNNALSAQTEQFTVIGQLLTVISQQNQQILQHLLNNHNNNNNYNYNHNSNSSNSNGNQISPPSLLQFQSQSSSPNSIDEGINLPIKNLNNGSIGVSNLHIIKPVGSVGDNVRINDSSSSSVQIISQILPDLHHSTTSTDPATIDMNNMSISNSMNRNINMNGLGISSLSDMNGISNGLDQLMSSSVQVAKGIHSIHQLSQQQLYSHKDNDDNNPETTTTSSSRSHSRSDSDEDPAQKFGTLKRINIYSFPYLSKFKKDIECFRTAGGRAPILRMVEKDALDTIMNYLTERNIMSVIDEWSANSDNVEDDEFFRWALWSMELESQQNLSECLDSIAKHARLRKQAPPNFIAFFLLVSELYDLLIRYSLNNNNYYYDNINHSSFIYTPSLFQSKLAIDNYLFEDFHSILKTYAPEKVVNEAYTAMMNTTDGMKNSLTNMNGIDLNSNSMNGDNYTHHVQGGIDSKLPTFIQIYSKNFHKEDFDEFLDRSMSYGHINGNNNIDFNDYESHSNGQRISRINSNVKPSFASLAAGTSSLNGNVNSMNGLPSEMPKLGSGCFSCGNAYHPDRCVRRGRDGKTPAYCWYKEKQKKGLTEAQKKLGNKHFEAWRASKDAKI